MQEILRLQPIYKEKIWGGRKLESFFQRNIPGGKIGESWEVSDYGKDLSVIQNGILKGKTLREAYRNDPEGILGKSKIPFREFPLLVKLLMHRTDSQFRFILTTDMQKKKIRKVQEKKKHGISFSLIQNQK